MVELACCNPCPPVIEDLEGHHDLLERGITRTLAEPVHGDVDAARPGFESGKGVGDGKSEIIVAVYGEGSDAERGDDRFRPFRGEQADGIAEAEAVCPAFDPALIHVEQELLVCPRRVLTGELDDESPLLRVFHRRERHRTDLVPRLSHLLLDMQVAHRHHQVDRVGTIIGSIVDIDREGPDIRADLRFESCIGDHPDRGPFTIRGGSRADLYHIHPYL